MSAEMILGFGERLIAGLQRKAVSTPSRWVQEYVRTPTKTGPIPFSFKRFPWQREMIDSKARQNCACKGAQLGVSHCVLCLGMCTNDLFKRDVLYVLPSMNPHGSDFSSARFDTLVAASPHLSEIYDRSNVGHKRTATSNFYIRGAQSRTGGKSVPASLLVLDEIDEIPKEFLPLVRERMSGQDVKVEWDISTPTIPDHGISKLWDESSQEFFMFPCPRCSRSIYLDIESLDSPRCLEVVGDDPDSERTLNESFLKCPECQGKILQEEKIVTFEQASFQPMVSGKEKRGFYINQLYSTTITPGEVAASLLRARMSEFEAQEFWNSKMGKAHASDGSRLSDEQINSCKVQHQNGATKQVHDVVTMGVDVGSWQNYEICEWKLGEAVGNDVNTMCIPRVLKTGRVRRIEDLDSLMQEFRPNMTCIDAMPERQKAWEFAQKWRGFVRLVFFSQGISGKKLTESKWESGEDVIHVDRTSWMDLALGRFKTPGRILIPQDVPYEYGEHLKVPSRIWVRGKDGNPHATYKCPDGKADHYAFSRVYSEIALALALATGQNEDIESPLD